MSASAPTNELSEFHQFLGRQLDESDEQLSPEEALDLWRSENPDPDLHTRNVAAVREAIADMQSGDKGRPAKEVLQEIRDDLGLGTS